MDITIRGNQYPIKVSKTGDIPCLCIGIGTLMERTLSKKFNDFFKLYSSDLYWISKNKLSDPTTLTLDRIVADISEMTKQLKLNKPFLLAHSCFGIVAIEAAKRYPDLFSGLILVASPPQWNSDVITTAQNFFDKYASSERKANDKSRREAYAAVKTEMDSCINLNVYEADSARYWADFNVSRKQLENLWAGVEVDDKIAIQFFNKLLPEHDLANNIEKLSVPVFLAAGRLDFDSIPIELWKLFPKPKDFTLLDCGEQAGHWPNIESYELFDSEVIQWVLTKQKG